MQRGGLGETDYGKESTGTRFNLGVGGDQENEVMRFALVIDAKSDRSDTICYFFLIVPHV